MGLVTRAIGRRDHPSNPTQRILRAFGLGNESIAGPAVTPSTVLGITAVYAAITILSQDVAGLPFPVYRRLDRGRERAKGHPLYRVLTRRANDEMSAFKFRETLQGHKLGWGNGYAEIEYDNAGRIKGLWPLRPDWTRAERDKETGALYYVTRTSSGGPEVMLPARRVFHVAGFGFDGIRGYSPITLFREAFGLALAVQEYEARFFGNGARPGLVLKTGGVLSEAALSRLRRDFEDRHMGLKNAERIAILEEGLDISTIGIPPKDAEFLGLRKFQTTEIARIYRLPPHMLADLSDATYSNIEHQGLGYVTYSLRHHMVGWEQEVGRQLLREDEEDLYYAEHVVDGLLRGDIKTRFEAYAIGKQNGFINSNMIAEWENWNPIDGGDEFYVPLNMIPVSQALTGEGSPGDESEPPRAASVEDVELRGLAGRRRLRGPWTAVFRDAAVRILRREESDVMRAAEKHLARRNVLDFQTFLAAFYASHAEYVERQLKPVLLGYGEAVQAEAAGEVGASAGLTGSLERFIVAGYLAALVKRWIGSSEGQLRTVLEEAIAENRDLLAALQERFDEWRDARADKVARRQVVESSEAVAREVWRSSGVTRLKWRKSGESCPYCNHLNGRTVGIDDQFLQPGQAFQPDGADVPLQVKFHVRHAPAHKGCDCAVVPVVSR